ncbi:MAG: serine/threonine protein kinase [Actinomycetales bacterium]|nr:serine/threonine protein kinase [Actinomycetales bacterium]
MNSPPQIPGLVYVQPLGSGGYADVYLYEQQSPRMPVAVKVLKAGSLTDRLKAEFFAEADTMAELGDHPYIVQVFRAGAATDGRPYLVMKYYPPPNLAQRSRTERFPVADVLRIGIQLASAVETAHQANVIHRDIKPANVLVSAYGAPGLTDFGIAGRGLRTHADAALHGVSGREEIGVSVPWSPPEVIYAESDGDARSDVYSLAATLWQLLAGRSPFEVPGQDNTAYALMPRIRTQPVPATGRPDVPPAVERVLATAMAKDPGHRPPTAMAFALELQAVEQELRLPRTQILVLDDRGRTRLTRPGAQGVASAAGQDTSHGADDRTHIKGPQRVQAQAPVAPSAPVAPAPVVLPTPAPAAPPMAATASQVPGMPGMPDTVGTAGTAGTARRAQRARRRHLPVPWRRPGCPRFPLRLGHANRAPLNSPRQPSRVPPRSRPRRPMRPPRARSTPQHRCSRCAWTPPRWRLDLIRTRVCRPPQHRAAVAFRWWRVSWWLPRSRVGSSPRAAAAQRPINPRSRSRHCNPRMAEMPSAKGSSRHPR